MSAVRLADFFTHFVPYVMGELGRADLEARLGSSPSGTRQLDVYAGVVRCNLSIALDAMYASVKRAADATAPGLWRRIVNDFLTAHPPRHADPNRCGEPLPAFLADRRAASGDLPVYLEELADYEWIRFCAATSKTIGRDRTIFARRYTHAVPTYAEATERCDDAAPPGERPAATPVMVVVFRSMKTLKTRVISPSAAQLFALARRQGELDDEHGADLLIRSELSERDLAQAEAQLHEMGLFDEERRP